MTCNQEGLDKVLIAIGNERRERGYGGQALAELEREGLVMTDPAWDGCITLTLAGWDRYALLTGQIDEENER